MFKGILSISILSYVSLFAAEIDHSGQSQSCGFVDVVKKCKPAVVHIRAEVPISRSYLEECQDEFYRLLGYTITVPCNYWLGSGFIVSPDGFIVTNYHVVQGATRIWVGKYDDAEKKLEAKLIGFDANSDVAILKIAGENLPYIEFADSDQIDGGQWIIAIGQPYGMKYSLSAGIVISAYHRGNRPISNLEDMIHIDARINTGSSGGPLLDLNGKVIGVIKSYRVSLGVHTGVGLAIPSNIVQRIFEEIRRNGIVEKEPIR